MEKINVLLLFLLVVTFSLVACGKQPEPESVSDSAILASKLQRHIW